jgi:hypothetical protein
MSDDFLGKSELSSVRKHFQLYVLTNSFSLVHLLIFTETHYLVRVPRVDAGQPAFVTVSLVAL